MSLLRTAMTAYVVLRDLPLGADSGGPRISVSAAEAGAYAGQVATGESLVRVASGEKITERQALMLASGDNMAEILARWDARSPSAFLRKMNDPAERLGMSSTHYADASGLNPASRSTAEDLLKLAPVAMAEPAFADIVGESSATIPLNTVRNYNSLVGRDGVIGIKTGSTDAAGGCLLFAAHHVVAGHTYTIYGALLGAPGRSGTILPNALRQSSALIVATGRSLHRVTVLAAGNTIATETATDGTTTDYTVADTLTVTAWSGQKFHLSLPTPSRPGEPPTTLSVKTRTTTLQIPLIPLIPLILRPGVRDPAPRLIPRVQLRDHWGVSRP